LEEEEEEEENEAWAHSFLLFRWGVVVVERTAVEGKKRKMERREGKVDKFVVSLSLCVCVCYIEKKKKKREVAATTARGFE
jgi:hypothetical protein